MATMTTTTQAVYIPEIWSKSVQEFLRSKLVLAGLVQRFDSEVANSGDQIHIPFDTELVANNKVQGVSVSYQNPTDVEVILTIDKHKESSFTVPNILKAQSHIDIMSRYTKSAGYAIAKAIDTDLAALASGFSNVTGTFNTAVTTDVILDSIELLDAADVPMEDRHFVFKADTKRALMDISTYTSSDFISGRPVETGSVSGSLYGVSTHMSENILQSGTSVSNMLFQRDALALAMQQSPSIHTDFDIDLLADKCVVDAIYGVREVRDTHGVLVRS